MTASRVQHIEKLFAGGRTLRMTVGLDEAAPGMGTRPLVPDRSRDQDPNGGRLSAQYCRATDQFLTSAGLDPADVTAVNQILAKYMGEETEDQGAQAAVQWPSGSSQTATRHPVARRTLAADVGAR
jgi:hypothetical protein